jgi:hypothetical protein
MEVVLLQFIILKVLGLQLAKEKDRKKASKNLLRGSLLVLPCSMHLEFLKAKK